MLSKSEERELEHALWVWVEHSSAPDEPFFGFAEISDHFMTPRELATAVSKRTANGEAFLRLLEYNVRRSSLEEVVNELVWLPDSAAS
jgi:hypothetical protein